MRRMHDTNGPYVNDFVQTDKLTMHAIVRTNRQPRVLFATPAGNTGIGLWFKKVKGQGIVPQRQSELIEHDGISGVALSLRGPQRLTLDRAMLDSVRALRDKDAGAEAGRDQIVKDALAVFKSEAGRKAGVTQETIQRLESWVEPREVKDPERPDTLILERRAFGLGARYRVEIVPEAGTTVARDHGKIVIQAEGETKFAVRSFIDRAPLAPKKQILRDAARDASQERNLSFLAFDEKLLAGS